MRTSSSHRAGRRVDERDTMFARAARRTGTREYAEYYARRPELRDIDDALRALPPLLAPGATFFDEALSAEAERSFRDITCFEPAEGLVEHWAGRIAGATSLSTILKDMALALGAVGAGSTRVQPELVYSHRGRHDRHYGEKITTTPGWALVFLVEMDHSRMGSAPRAPVIAESARQYLRAARISLTMAAALERTGIAARSQHDAHYDLILPALAVAAGLGELGRNNILVADRFGSRVRIGAVTMEEPLVQDEVADLGVRGFCEICRKCAENCPSGSLSSGAPSLVRGVSKWPTRVESCYRYWRTVGTDCGICMACCPFSHKSNWLHGIVRRLVRRSRLAARVALRCDDLVYSRRWATRRMRWL